jgi:hypothetical protein
MNGTSGLQEVRSSALGSQSFRFLHEQRHRFGVGSWHTPLTDKLIALSTGISTKREKIPDISMPVAPRTYAGSMHRPFSIFQDFSLLL